MRGHTRAPEISPSALYDKRNLAIQHGGARSGLIGSPSRLTGARDGSTTGGVSTVDDLSDKLDFLQGTLEVLILRSLALGPNHAYGISQFLKQESDQAFIVDNGSLYPALQRLLQRGWIAGQWKTSPNARRARYYRLTPAGKRQLVVGHVEVAALRRQPWGGCSPQRG